MPSIAIFAPWLMLASMSRKPAGLPDISRPTSKPSVMPELLLHVGEFLLAHIHRQGDAQLFGQLQAVRD